jgi:type II secretory pathway predicted ATPase ExeA
VSSPVDPFGATADPGSYVARPACEECLRRLAQSVDSGAPITILSGPPGFGKSLLLRVLADRIDSSLDVAQPPYPALEPRELAAWTLRELGEDPGNDPARELRERCQRAEAAVVLVVDDAHSLPLETARFLADLATGSAGALRVLVAFTDGTDSPAQGAFGDVEPIRLAEPMSEAELGEYLETRLERGGATPDQRARFDPTTRARLQQESGGVPVVVHELATAVLRDRLAPEGTPQPEAELATSQETTPEDELVDEDDESAVEGEAESPARSSGARSVALLALFALGAAMFWLVPELASRIQSAPPPPSLPPTTHPPPTVTTTLPPPTTTTTLPAPVLAPDPEPEPPPPEPEPFTLDVNAVPWAEIEVDGEPAGTTPLGGLEVEPGPHSIRARMPDGRVLERSIEVEELRTRVSFD